MTLEKALRQLAARADKPGAETTDDLACLAREVEVIGEAVLDSISDVAMPLLQVLLATDSAAAGILPCARAADAHTRKLATCTHAHVPSPSIVVCGPQRRFTGKFCSPSSANNCLRSTRPRYYSKIPRH